MTNDKKWQKFKYAFIIWIIIFAVGMVKKNFQNDTFYTIKIGESIIKYGIDMLDHFSIHANLAYTYPHWLYDLFIYYIYKFTGFTGLYISTIILFIMLLLLVFKTNYKMTKNYLMAAFGTFICALTASAFATARAQLVTFILFVLEIYFIESFLNSGKKRNLIGLILISLIICNIHVAVWPFYFIIYLPYLAEYIVAIILKKIKLKKEYKFINFLKKKIIIEKNDNVKYLFLIMILSILTGLITPLGDTPYTYLIKTMMGNSQKYIQEHQMISWKDSPFAIVIAVETIFLAFFSKAKIRDLFMICGLIIMSITSIRHLSLLAVIGTICFTRIFGMFLDLFEIDINNIILNFIQKKVVTIIFFVFASLLCIFLLNFQLKKNYVDPKSYPVNAVKYIKENLDINNIKLFNEYNYGSYLILNDIPVFIDSRADLYTKQFSGLEYDIFDDFEYMPTNYQEKFEFYNITHALLNKDKNGFVKTLTNDEDYEIIYEDEYFILFKKLRSAVYVVKIEN